jgi:hypothetical protein
MNKAMATAAKRKLNAFGRMERRARIFAWLSEDWSTEEVALVERLTTRRINQIVSDAVKKRKIHLQRDQAFLDSLLPEPALAAADGGAAGPDVAAIRTYLKFLAGSTAPSQPNSRLRAPAARRMSGSRPGSAASPRGRRRRKQGLLQWRARLRAGPAMRGS